MMYRKKPVTIEAIQFTGDNREEIEQFITVPSYSYSSAHLVIPTLAGLMYADTGDWIIKGIKGEFYPCKPDVFDATYEAAE